MLAFFILFIILIIKIIRYMKTLLCSIGRMENKYIREWVEYNKNLGFTNIVLYDNNYDGEEDFTDVIGDYIESGYVILKNYRNKKVCQLQAYNECYSEYNKKYDWIAFFDCDEFLTFTKKNTIEEYLSQMYFNRYDMIHINWRCYGDSDLVRNDGRPLLERFTEPIPDDKPVAYRFPENNHIKSIIRGGLKNVTYKVNPHTPQTVNKCCNNRGISCNGASAFEKFNFSEAYLRHFSTKTIEEYCDKLKRGFPDGLWNLDKMGEHLLETRFFRYNKVTQEKLDVIKEVLGIEMKLVPEQEKVYSDNGKRKDVQLFMLCYDKEEYDFVDNEVMTPIQCGAANGKDVCALKDNTGENISQGNFFFVENTGTFWIWKNIKDARYKGQTQYRRRLIGVDEKTNYDEIFKNYDIICAKPYNYPENKTAFIPEDTLLEGYGYSHCKKDLECLGELLKESHPEYADDWENVIVNGQDLYYSNGFVLTAEKYDEYCNFLFEMLGKWLNKNNIQTYEDLIVHVARNMGAGYYPRYEREGKDVMELTWPSIHYQLRIGGYLSERIFTLWVNHNIPKERRYEVEYQKMEQMYI